METVDQKNNDEEAFFAEMDRSEIHRSCCTCQSMTLLFTFVLVVLTAGLFYIYWQITREKVFAFKLPANISLQSFSNRLNNLQNNSLNNLEITLSNEEITALLSEGLNFQTFLLKEIQVQILPTQVLIYGRLIKPLKSKVVISAIPKIKDNKIYFETTGVTAGNLNFPNFLNPQISKALNDLISPKLLPIYNKFNIQEIKLNENNLTIYGQAK